MCLIVMHVQTILQYVDTILASEDVYGAGCVLAG